MRIDMPAFPRADVTGAEDDHLWEQGHPGMTLRQYAAIQILPTVVAICRHDTEVQGKDYATYCAERAYEFADAMLSVGSDNREGSE